MEKVFLNVVIRKQYHKVCHNMYSSILVLVFFCKFCQAEPLTISSILVNMVKIIVEGQAQVFLTTFQRGYVISMQKISPLNIKNMFTIKKGS